MSLLSSHDGYSPPTNQNHLNSASFRQLSRHGASLHDQHHDTSKVDRWLDSQATVSKPLFCQLDGGETLKTLDLNGDSTLESMKSSIGEYVSQDSIRVQLKRCAQMLVQKRRWRSGKPAWPFYGTYRMEVATHYTGDVHPQSTATKDPDMPYSNVIYSIRKERDRPQTADRKANPSQNSRTKQKCRVEISAEKSDHTVPQIKNPSSNYSPSNGVGGTRCNIQSYNRAEVTTRNFIEQQYPTEEQAEPQKFSYSVSETMDIDQYHKGSEYIKQRDREDPNLVLRSNLHDNVHAPR